MNRKNLVTGIAITAALAVVALFFIFNSYLPMSSQSEPSTTAAASPSDSGLIVQDETVGTGATAEPGDSLTVNYTGKLQDGTVFDTSIGRAPFSFILGAQQVIPGWDMGLQGMKVGGKRLLIIPPDLAYGNQMVGSIPANSTLVFEVDLLSATPATSTPTATDSTQ
jgi:FKBP-type peptidyl-prolyl cis-trans isomerase